jgi:hypothetical protein
MKLQLTITAVAALTLSSAAFAGPHTNALSGISARPTAPKYALTGQAFVPGTQAQTISHIVSTPRFGR